MSYRIDLSADPGAELRRIALEQIDKALAELGDPALDVHDRVHQFRKRAKKLRALARLVRPGNEDWYRQENRDFRDLARRYAALREARVLPQTLNRLRQSFDAVVAAGAWEALAARFAAHERHVLDESAVSEKLPVLARALEASRQRVADWHLDVDIGQIVDGFAKTYGRGRRARNDAGIDAPAGVWHELRKRAKYERFHWKLLRDCWPGIANAYRDELAELGELLGEDHDLADLKRHAATLGTAGQSEADAIRALADARSGSLRRRALPLAARLYAEPVKRRKKRLAAWLETAVAEARRPTG